MSEAHNEGTIVSVSDGVIRIHGLADCMQGEMISLPGNRYAIALNLERDSVGAVVMGPYADLAEGMKVKCTGRILEVPVGRGLLGRVVNTLGAPIDGKGPLDHDGFSAVEAIAPGVIERQSVDQPVQTGYKAVDSMIPIGRGQRELIIGDRQTGKTALHWLSMPSSTSAIPVSNVSMSLSARKRPPFLTWYVNWKSTAHWLTPSLW